MEEHQVRLQKEQIKQSVKQEVLNGIGSSTEEYLWQIYRKLHRTHDDLQLMYEDSFDLYNQRRKEQDEASTNKNKQVLNETATLSSDKAKQQTKQDIIKETKQMSTEHIIQELQYMSDTTCYRKI